ncbi:helix-turn-helix domain-containing protein [Paenibacillus sp.]|uniref:helix-turn-helix domain-containing protein n=1 Tax=Paenibacillus sp. TaxID=58172 RepID=UPI0034648D4C
MEQPISIADFLGQTSRYGWYESFILLLAIQTQRKKSPIEYLTDLRMNQAKQQLLQPSGKIRDINRDVGYKDEFLFSRRYKTYSGIAPTVYMKQRRIQIVSLSQPYTDHLFTLSVNPFVIPIDKEAPMQ